MKRYRVAYELLRHMEPRLLALRAKVMVRKRLGFERRTFTPRPWNDLSLSSMMRAGTPADPRSYARYKRAQRLPFLFPLGQPPRIALPFEGERDPGLNERVALLGHDRCVYFFQQPSPRAFNWHENALEQKRVTDPERSWFEIADFSPEQGDLRMLWEPARAAWAFDLARARARGRPTLELAPLFRRWLDSWMAASPPFRGVHWKCGQESAVRFVALAFAFWALDVAPAADDAEALNKDARRWLKLARLAWATGYRVAHHIEYAVSQKNNHALSEACGLLLVTQLFPELKQAAGWRALGRQVLERELARQVYPDGSYVQHSLNYERVMLQVSTLALRLAELAGEPLSAGSYESLRRASLFLFQLTEGASGWTPLYGNDDGALVLPLTECHYRDFRPAIQAAHAVATRKRLLEAGPWDEEASWLLGAAWSPDRDFAVGQRSSHAFEAGGYYTLRRERSWAMIRCHRYRDRPGHYDPLHVDLWWRGHNVLRDCGSYRYYDPEEPALERYFKSAAAHNTLTLDRGEPIELVSRFLWLPWPRARALRHVDDAAGPGVGDTERVGLFVGESLDYARSPWHVVHRRTLVALSDERWLVIDDLLGAGVQRWGLRWHLPDVPIAREGDAWCLQTEAGPFWLAVRGEGIRPERLERVRGRRSGHEVQGFEAPHYGALRSIPTLEATWCAELPCRVVTSVSALHIAAEEALRLARGVKRSRPTG